MAENHRLRINLAQREVEIEGSLEFVERFAERFETLLGRLEEGVVAPPLSAANDLPLFQEAAAPKEEASGRAEYGSFGEYLHALPASSTEVDRMLAAGFYFQQQASDNTFATGDANKRLAEHGIKIGNPSQCVRQSLMAKRVFMVNRGRYRVSQQGRTYLRQLMGSVIPA